MRKRLRFFRQKKEIGKLIFPVVFLPGLWYAVINSKSNQIAVKE